MKNKVKRLLWSKTFSYLHFYTHFYTQGFIGLFSKGNLKKAGKLQSNFPAETKSKLLIWNIKKISPQKQGDFQEELLSIIYSNLSSSIQSNRPYQDR